MTTPNTASKLTWPDDRSLKSAARLPVERSRASSAEDAANDGRPRRARSSEPRGGFAEGPKLALTLEEAAAELSVSTATIRRMITAGASEPCAWAMVLGRVVAYRVPRSKSS